MEKDLFPAALTGTFALTCTASIVRPVLVLSIYLCELTCFVIPMATGERRAFRRRFSYMRRVRDLGFYVRVVMAYGGG